MRRRIMFVGVLVLIPLVMVLIATEIYVRLYSPYGYITPEILRGRSPEGRGAIFARYVYPRMEQNIPDETGRILYDINALGYRGEPFEMEKPRGVTRIMIYGGSSTFDLGAHAGQDWPHRVQARLRESGFPEVEVINAGVGGHASYESVGRLFAEGHLLEPDYVLLYNAWNDVKDFQATETLLRLHPPVLEEDPRTNYRNFLDRWLSETSQLYVRLRSRYFTWKYRIGPEGRMPEGAVGSTLSEMALRQYRMNIQTFVDVARNAGAQPLLITQGRLVSRDNTPEQKERIAYELVLLTHDALWGAMEATDRIIKEVAEEKNVPVIDAASVLTGRDEFFRDHVHLTPEGSSALARTVADGIAPLLADTAGDLSQASTGAASP